MTEKELIKLIKEDQQLKKDKYIARDYYKFECNNDDIKEKEYEINVTDSKGNIRTIKIKKDVDLYINYFKMLVNQKIEYLLTKEPTINSKLPFSMSQLQDLLKDLMLNASLDTTSWLHLYVDNNVLDWVIISDKEIIPIYKKNKKDIEAVIRYYEVDDEIDKEAKNIKVEYWTIDGVVISIIKKDKIIDVQNYTHVNTELKLGNEIIDTQYSNLPFIPFIPFYNNKQHESDIAGIKEIIDYYNDVSSGFIDNIYKFQEAITKLKGFAGSEEVLEETSKQLKKYKMVGLPEGGDIEAMTVEIPVEARQFILDFLKDAMFSIGRGYNPDKIGDGNITNIVIKSRYFPLDNKSNETIAEEKRFYETFITNLNLYYSANYDIIIDNNKNQLFNESEKLTDCINAIDLVNAGLLSKKTLIANIPWVIDVGKELEQINEDLKEKEEEAQEYLMEKGQNPSNVNNSGQNPSNVKENGDNE